MAPNRKKPLSKAPSDNTNNNNDFIWSSDLSDKHKCSHIFDNLSEFIVLNFFLKSGGNENETFIVFLFF